MELTEEDLREFSRLWREEFHEEITPEDARAVASSLVELYWVLARPLPTETGSTDTNEVLPLLPQIK